MSVSPEQALHTHLAALSSAEDFFAFFAVPYDEHVVNVNRLHILKRYRQYLLQEAELAAMDPAALVATHRAALAQAHEDFVHSSGVEEKVFEVFQQAAGRRHVTVETLKAGLPSRRRAASPPAR